jgi:large subunit ribosomal protein L9
MKIILKENIVNLGSLGTIIEVNPGFARNFLIPFSKAINATKKNVEEFKKQKEMLRRVENDLIRSAKSKAKNILLHNYIIERKVGENDKLFGSINSIDIASAISSTANIKVEKKNIKIVENTIRKIGQFSISLRLHEKVKINIVIFVKAKKV